MPIDIDATKARIAEIETLLASGVRSVQYKNGDRTEFDLESLERERARLSRQLALASTGSQFRKVTFSG